MKKIFLLSIFILLSGMLSAQTFKGGLMLGMSTTQYDGDTYGGYHRIGLIGGGYVGHEISAKLSWQMEIKYFQKGSYQSSNIDAGIPYPYDLRLNYIEMPFLLKYTIRNKLSMDAGLGLGYLASHRENINDVPSDPTGIRPFHKYEFSYQIGGSYQILPKLAVNIRYVYSILPVRPHAGGGRHGLNWGEYNNVISFSFYYQFKKKDE
jgi:hypothetical protein